MDIAGWNHAGSILTISSVLFLNDKDFLFSSKNSPILYRLAIIFKVRIEPFNTHVKNDVTHVSPNPGNEPENRLQRYTDELHYAVSDKQIYDFKKSG
jgi:hypothetical protein